MINFIQLFYKINYIFYFIITFFFGSSFERLFKSNNKKNIYFFQFFFPLYLFNFTYLIDLALAEPNAFDVFTILKNAIGQTLKSFDLFLFMILRFGIR